MIFEMDLMRLVSGVGIAAGHRSHQAGQLLLKLLLKLLKLLFSTCLSDSSRSFFSGL